jgi:hypothetical protein
MTVSIVEDFIPPGRRNRPGHALTPKYITIHDTANTRAGADALAHASYLKGNTAANIPVSWHFTVDDKVSYQHLPLNENGWHAGDGRGGVGNRQSIGIEICENQDGNRARAEANAAWLTAKLLTDFRLGIDAVRQHHDWVGKNCPRVLRGRGNGWSGFLSAVQSHLTADDLTPIIGQFQAGIEQALAWARARGAHQRFIDVAPVYWQYGALTGIRPEVLYAQSSKETAFGRFGGAVTPDQNNWAGIKTRNATGDLRADHETFITQEDGVRAHFNHMAAYVGIEPIGIPHGRYHVVMRLGWAGTVRHLEELGGKWAPAEDYGRIIVRDYLNPLLFTSFIPDPQPGDRLPPLPIVDQLPLPSGEPGWTVSRIIKTIQWLLEKLKVLIS